MKEQAKTCFCCKQSKPKSLFFRSKNTTDGLHSWCKDCCAVGNTKSRARLNSTIEGRAKVFLRNAKNSALKRGQKFDLSIDDIVSFWHQQQQICAYSGRVMTLEAGHHNTVSIERIDSEVGYIPSNVVLVCQAINRMKSDFGFGNFYKLCCDVAKFLGNKKLELSVGAYK